MPMPCSSPCIGYGWTMSLKQAGDLSGKVVVNCSLPMHADDTGLVIGHTSSGA